MEKLTFEYWDDGRHDKHWQTNDMHNYTSGLENKV